MLLDKIKEIGDTLIAVHTKIGYKMFKRYVILIICLIAALNAKTIATGAIQFVSEISDEIHSEKMKLQEDYYTDLSPLLAEFRAETGADRVLYFEYHNSEESLEGMPFKFFNLMKCMPRYGIPEVPGSVYKDISASMYTELFKEIGQGKVVICRGFDDIAFRKKYRGVYELLSESDNSKQMVIFSIPGIRKPVGFIALEWMSEDAKVVLNEEIVHSFLPRINAISAYSRKK